MDKETEKKICRCGQYGFEIKGLIIDLKNTVGRYKEAKNPKTEMSHVGKSFAIESFENIKDRVNEWMVKLLEECPIDENSKSKIKELKEQMNDYIVRGKYEELNKSLSEIDKEIGYDLYKCSKE